MQSSDALYEALVLLAGFIDSIAGGGGLITVPIMTLLLGPGAHAIGTNKILGLAAALTALIVYTRKGHLQIKGSIPFLIGLCLGTLGGAKLGAHLPTEYFTWFLIGVLPFLLFIILKRDSLLTQTRATSPKPPPILFILGFLCGGYDGVFGPGGGTFMFLSLVIFGGFQLLAALATAKLANTLSAGVSLLSYASDGFVHWAVGFKLMIFCMLGAAIGSQLANKKAKTIVRPVLAFVVILLLIRLILNEVGSYF